MVGIEMVTSWYYVFIQRRYFMVCSLHYISPVSKSRPSYTRIPMIEVITCCDEVILLKLNMPLGIVLT